MIDFLTWHYTDGQIIFYRLWKDLIVRFLHYFSLPLLLKSLFSPWKRLTSPAEITGFNLPRIFEKFTYNFISRGIGFFVRLLILPIALFSLITLVPLGLISWLIWMIFPFLSLGFYRRYQNKPANLCSRLVKLVNKSADPFNVLFNSLPGKFVLAHSGLRFEEATSSFDLNSRFTLNHNVTGFYDILTQIIDRQHLWPPHFFRQFGLIREDFLLAASWWDKRQFNKTNFSQNSQVIPQPGIGLSLLFGYTPYLNQSATDLTQSVPRTELVGREHLLSRMESALESGVGVILTGIPGVGKRSLALEYARRAASGSLGFANSYYRILELNFHVVLSGVADLSTKKTILRFIFNEAAAAGNIILVIRDLQRLTNAGLEGYDFTDILEEVLEKKSLRVITLATPGDYEKFIVPNQRLKKLFETIPVPEISKIEVLQTVLSQATLIEEDKSVTITTSAIRKLIEASDKYFNDKPQPANTIDLLEMVVNSQIQSSSFTVTSADVLQVISEKSGIPFIDLNSQNRNLLSNLEKFVSNKLVGQDIAVSLIAQSLRARTMGVGNENRPVGSFLFLGPTGVGKTETAKVLSDVFFGGQDKILRFDMAEYAGREGITRLIGSVDYNQPGLLTTSLKNNSFGMLLLDEFEKSPTEIYNLFLTLLDEGYLLDAFNNRINCRHIFIIATSNAGSEIIRQLVSQGIVGEELQRRTMEYILSQNIFSPELLNRFDGVVVFQPLSPSDLTAVAKLMLEELKIRLENKNLYLHYLESTGEKLAKDGYNPMFGARPMRRLVDIVIGDLISRSLLDETIKPGDHLLLEPGGKPGEFKIHPIPDPQA